MKFNIDEYSFKVGLIIGMVGAFLVSAGIAIIIIHLTCID